MNLDSHLKTWPKRSKNVYLKTKDMNRIQIAPSILSADLLRLEEQVKLVAEQGADDRGTDGRGAQ